MDQDVSHGMSFLGSFPSLLHPGELELRHFRAKCFGIVEQAVRGRIEDASVNRGKLLVFDSVGYMERN